MDLENLFKKREIKYISNSSKETKRIAKSFAKELLKREKDKKRNRALIIALKGELGGGKTTFLQGFAKGLEINEKVLSPTFVLMKKYDINLEKSPFKTFYHLDCYRIKSEAGVATLNLDEIIKNPKSLLAIEWAERIKKIIEGENRIDINFKFIDKEKREIKISLN